MKFVVGLGNQGKKYEGTRHNIGFKVVDLLSTVKWQKKEEFDAYVAGVNKNTWLVKSELFVNQTGATVSGIAERYSSQPRDFLVVCDDVNLAFGKMRLRSTGSAGGHHGLESIIAALGSEDFPRLRIGVGNDRMPKDLVGFVLERFLPDEKKNLPKILGKAAQVCEVWATKGFDSALNKLSVLQGQELGDTIA